tara:strand:- start:5860 stop:6372 length:513 start_codon:yes stop_codon:yes gene_type:complete
LKPNKQIRKIHYWISPFIFIPILIILSTGILLQLKKQSDWIQPPIQQGVSNIPSIEFEEMLEAAKSVLEAEINSWEDIDRIDVRPDKGISKIRSNNQWEIQIDNQTKEILSVEYRRSDVIESIHDGSFFTDYVKFGWFLPAAILLIFMSISGIYMFLLPLFMKRKKAKLK